MAVPVQDPKAGVYLTESNQLMEVLHGYGALSVKRGKQNEWE